MSILETKLMIELDRRKSTYYNKIQEVFREVESVLNTRIPVIFPYYTQHDVNHSLRIMSYMYELIEDINRLNDLEIALLVYAALLHDIGMAPDEEEIVKIKSGELTYEGVNYEMLLGQFSDDSLLALQEFIREVHAYRSSEYIKRKLAHHFFIPDMPEVSFANELAKICEAHTKDFYWLAELDNNTVKGTYNCNLQYSAMLLRLGDILDFDSSRTPARLFEASKPLGYSLGEWKQHFVIENKQKIITNDIGMKIIEFYGECKEPKIHRKILSYLGWVEAEINNALELSEKFKSEHKFNLHYRVNNYIKSKDYKIVDLKFDFNYLNIIEILMGEELYGNKRSGLREIIQNSIDACNHKKAIYEKIKEPWENEFAGNIDIILKQSSNEVIIKDNGIGMDYSIIKRYFLELGSSYYKSKEFKILDGDYNPIGNYGIGFLAGFMISSKILVRTRHYKSNSIIELEVEKEEQYVAIKEIERPNFIGTEIVLNLNEFYAIWNSNVEELQNYLNEKFLFKEIAVHVFVENENKGFEKIKINDVEFSGGVDLSKYLNDVELKVKYSSPIRPYKKYLTDVLDVSAVILEDEEIVYITDTDETLLLENYIQNSKLETVEVIMIADEDIPVLEKALLVYDGADEIIEYVWDHFSPETLEVISKGRNLIKDKTLHFENSEDIFYFNIENLNDFEDVYHNNKLGTFYTKKEYRLFEVEGINKYIELRAIESNRELLSWDHMKRFYRKLFVRGIYVKDYNYIYLDNIIEHLSIQDIKINVLNPSIIPTVNRNSLKENDEIIIKNSVYIAICLDILDNTQDPVEKILMRNYLDDLMDFSNSLIKKEFHPKS